MKRNARETQVLEEIRNAIASKSGLPSGYTAVLFGSRACGTSGPLHLWLNPTYVRAYFLPAP